MTAPSVPSVSSSGRVPWGLIDRPLLSATLQTWERHLHFLKNLPDNTSLKEQMIADVEHWMEVKKLRGDK
jgi:hypothetical protein